MIDKVYFLALNDWVRRSFFVCQLKLTIAYRPAAYLAVIRFLVDHKIEQIEQKKIKLIF